MSSSSISNRCIMLPFIVSKGNYLILYDIKGVALSALPLYSLEQLDSMIEKYGLNAASNISEDVCEGT